MISTEYGKKVSIIVPVYNVEAYLRPCIESLIGQTYKNIELLLIDDGSTDGSGTICDEYAAQDPRIRIWHKENGGVSSARNAGIDMASGEYLIFVDSDDWVLPELISSYMKRASSDVVVLSNHTADKEQLRKNVQRELGDKADIYERTGFMRFFCDDHVNSPVDKLYCTEIIRKYKIRFVEGKSLGEDLLFNLDYLRYAPEKYQVIQPPLYYYRENRDGSLSTSYRKDLFQVQRESFASIESFLKDMNIWTSGNQTLFFALYWERLYLVARMCREYEKENPEEHCLSEILKDPVWEEVWRECRAHKALNLKRRIKRIHLLFMGRWKR